MIRVSRGLNVAISGGALAIIFCSLPQFSQAQTAGEKSAEGANATLAAESQGAAEEWGAEANGIRCRLVAVPTGTNDESPDLEKSVGSFARGADVAFVVELKNTGEKPAALMGVRYGDSYGTSKGKLATPTFGPQLFEFDVTDSEGKPIPRPKRDYIRSMMGLSGVSMHELTTGQSLPILLRPAKFSAPMDIDLPPGKYRARVRYHGAGEKEIAQIKEHWPDKPQAKAWLGEVTSNEISFEVAADPTAPKPAKLHWGEVNEGLRAAVEMRERALGRTAEGELKAVPLNTAVGLVYYVQNASEQPIAFVSETWRQGDRVFVRDARENLKELQGTWYSGVPVMVRWTLKPGEVAELYAPRLGIVADKNATKQLQHRIGPTLVATPGNYGLRVIVRMGSIQSKDDKGNSLFPAKTDWQGELTTGDTPFTVRERTEADEARERANDFVGRIEFVGKDGTQIGKGSFTARTLGKRADSPPIEIRAGGSEIPDCNEHALMVEVRASGYEAEYLNDVKLKPGETKKIELKPAEPTRLRLISAKDGLPVAGANVRFFAKSLEKAGGGLPMNGVRGPVWAVSEADGLVVLDTLQKTDPYYEKLGDALYYFYVEAPNFAGQFLSAVKAGQDLGYVKLAVPLEVHGEVQGTDEELKRFAAEWDQPLDMRSEASTYVYADSQRLTVKREGDKLTFHLTSLRPGKLRLITNFDNRPHSVSHTYGRRDPKGNDMVVELDLKESVNDLVLTSKGREK